nr:MAG TPA: Tape measure domain protein [Caudoviricetes sp.]
MDAGKFDGIDAKIVESYKENTQLLKEAERELKVYDFSSKQENQADKLRQEQEKYKLLLDKNKRDQSRAETDAQHEMTQSLIDAMDEGSKKTLAQRKLNHEKELEAIRREAEDRKLKLIENARSEFEANPENIKKSFDAESFAKSEPAQRQFKKIEEVRDIKIRTSNIKYNRGDDLSGLLDEYKDYTDERLALEKKFNDDIAVLEAQRRQAVKDGNAALIGQIDRAKAQATKDKGEQLMRLDYGQLKKSPEYVRAFENLKQTSTETLSSLLSQLEEAKRTAAEVLNPEDLREYTSTIQSIVDELTERNPFQTIIAKKKELARAEQELAKAKKLLDATDKKGYAILADYDEKTGETVYTYLTATEALKKYNEAKDHVIKTDGELQAAEKKVSEQVGELANALKDIGGVIGGTSGEIISLMGDIYSFASLSMEGISKLSSEAAKEMSALEKASVILGIISAAIRLLQQLDSLIGDAHSQYEGYAEKIAEINRLTDAVNEYRLAALEAQQAEKNWFSKDNLGNLRDYRELHEEIADAYDKKANEKQAVYENEGGGGWLTSLWKPFTTLIDKTYGKVFGFNINKEYEEGTAKATDNLRIETRKKSKGFLGTGIGGKSQKTEDLVTWARKNGFGELFDDDGLINKEAGKAILEKYGDKLVGQTKETLEELLELREKYDEYIDQLHEYVNSMYEPLVDNFVDAIFDWLDTGKDALDSFRDYASDTFRNIARDMVKSLVISQIFGTGEDSFQNKINALYEQYSKGELTEEELNRKVAEETALLGKKAEEKLPVIQESTGVIMDTLEQVTGIDLRDKGGSTSQSSTSGYSSVASQESIDETNGRLTGVQMGVEEVKEQVYKQTEIQISMVETMKTLYNLNYEHYTEIQDMTQNSLNILEDINKDTKQLYFIVECLKKIETNTK